MTNKPPKAPPGLQAAGRRVFREIHAEYQFDGQPDAVMLVEELARTADMVARLQRIVDDADQLRCKGSRGQDVAIPELDALRAYRQQFAALVRQLDLPQPLPPTPEPSPALKMTRHEAARKAAQARWNK
jgi:hypothetical protein